MPVYLLILMFSFSAFTQTLNESARRMSEIEDVIKSLNQQDCPDIPAPAFSSVWSGIPVACGGSSPRNGYLQSTIIDCTRDGKEYPGGLMIRAKEGHPFIGNARSLYTDGGPVERSIEFVSRNGALNETYLRLEDLAGGPDSHDMKSKIFLLPRKNIPQAETRGDEVFVKMSTGEQVVFDKRTGAIKSGALREGPIDLTTDRFRRTPPNVNYTGTGISIRLNHRYEEPTISSVSAEIKQGNRTCTVPRTQLFDEAGKLKTSSDAQFVTVLNQSCPARPGQQPFRI